MIQAASLFEQFWSHFPRRNGRPLVGKQASLLLFRELDEAAQAACVQAAKHYRLASRPRPDGGFVPEPRDPERFLKKGWWEAWTEGPVICCDFRVTPACAEPVEDGTSTCMVHRQYREKIAALQQRKEN